MSDMRVQILEVAAELFADSGYEAVSMRDIAKRVGVTQANLYYHFQGKADLIEATLSQVFTARAAELDSWLANHPNDQFQAFIHWLVRALMTDRTFARLLYRELLDGDENRIAALSRTVLQVPFQTLVAAVEERHEPGTARATALSYLGFAVGQVLVLPLSAGLVGASDESASIDAVAARLLSLINASQLEI